MKLEWMKSMVMTGLIAGNLMSCEQANVSTLTSTNEDAEDKAALLKKSFQVSLDEYIYMSEEPAISMNLSIPGVLDWEGFAGYADVRTKEKLDEDHLMQIGSNTKTMLMTMIMQMAEEGLIDLEDPLEKYLPEYPRWGQATIRQLLQMSAGIPDFSQSPNVIYRSLPNLGRYWSPKQIMDLVKNDELDYQPGTSCQYSQTNYIILGVVLERVSGSTFSEQLRQRISEPLGLTHTYYQVQDDVDGKMSHGYSNPGGFMKTVYKWLKPNTRVSSNLVEASSILDPSIAGTTGAVVTSVGDLQKFTKALFVGNTLLNDASKSAMTDFKTCGLNSFTLDYGLGLMRWETSTGPIVGHGGATPLGYRSTLMYDKSNDMTLAYQSNYLSSQIYGLVNQHMNMVASKAPLDKKACIPPQSVFQDDHEYAARFKIKGQIKGSPDDPSGWTSPSIGQIRLFKNGVEEESNFSIAGIFTSKEEDREIIKITGMDLGEKDPLKGNLGSLGSLPPFKPKDKNAFNIISLSLGRSWLDKSSETSHSYQEAGNDSEAFVAIQEINRVKRSESDSFINKVCYKAVSTKAPSLFYLCQDKHPAADELRLTAEIPLTSDKDEIMSILSSRGISSRCECRSNGAPVPCPSDS